MENKKKVEVDIQTRATASLNKSVAEDLKKADGNMEDLLEDTNRNDRDAGTGNNSNSNQQIEVPVYV